MCVLFKSLSTEACSPGPVGRWLFARLQINRSHKSRMEGENYILRMACGGGLREGKRNWKLTSCEMIEMEGDILKCSKICILRKSVGSWKNQLSKKKMTEL